MSYGIATLSIIPCRAEPSDKTEIISQLLFGEHYEVLEEQEKWVKIRNAYDQYEGWICRKQFTEINNKFASSLFTLRLRLEGSKEPFRRMPDKPRM